MLHNEKEYQTKCIDIKDVQLGDILFFKTRGSLTNKIIQTIQGIKSKTNSDLVHVALCLDKTNTGIPIIGHLMPAGFKIESILQKFQRLGMADQSFSVFRLAQIEEFDSYRCFVTQAMEKFKLQNIKYDKLGSFYSLFFKKHFSLNFDEKAFCSSIIAKCLIQAKVPGFENYNPNISPKKLYQDCKKNNLFFELSYVSSNEHTHEHKIKRKIGYKE